MKNTGAKIVVGVLLLVVVTGAVFFTLSYVTAKVTLYVAAEDIQPHQVLHASDLVEVAVHKSVGDLPSNYITDPAEVEGKHARTIILANQLVSRDMIAEFNEAELGILALGPEERLAVVSFASQSTGGVTVPASILTELLQPGDTVSLIAVTQDGRAKTFAQGVMIIGMVIGGGNAPTGQEGGEETMSSPFDVTVSLMLKVTPELMEQIAAAQAGGSVLVGIDPYEFKVLDTPGANINEMVGTPEVGNMFGY